jgi:hypothetical protein
MLKHVEVGDIKGWREGKVRVRCYLATRWINLQMSVQFGTSAGHVDVVTSRY